MNNNEKIKKRQVEIDKENGYKICTKCNNQKTLSEFFFNKKRNIFFTHCKRCLGTENKPKIKLIEIDLKNGFKICNKCKQTKKLNDFYFIKECNAYRAICKNCEHIRVINKRIPKIAGEFIKDGIKVKQCNKCNNIKPIEEFPKSRGKGTRREKCIDCKEKFPVKITKRKQVDIDRERGWKICEKCQNIKELNKFYFYKKPNIYAHCKDCTNKKNKNNYIKNIESRKKQIIKWRHSNIKRLKIKRKERHKNRMKTDLEYRTYINLNRSIRDILNGKKIKRTKQLLGCSIEFFIQYIESKFLEGMFWQNRGNRENQWGVDHILPCELFDFTKESHQLACLNYKNLQPLWGRDNSIKSDKLPDGRFARYLTREEKDNALKKFGFGFLFEEISGCPEQTPAKQLIKTTIAI